MPKSLKTTENKPADRFAKMKAYVREYMKPLVGGTILACVDDSGPETVTDFGAPVFGLLVKRSDGGRSVAWIMCDAEGNGPGFIDIQEVK